VFLVNINRSFLHQNHCFDPQTEGGFLVVMAKDYLETAFFLLLTLSLYFLYLITIPIFSEPHGLLAMSELSDITHSGIVLDLVFGSAILCVGLGVFMLNWLSFLTPGMMANLWATTYLFLWVDTIFSLSQQSKTYTFLLSLILGVCFIYLFFFVINYLDFTRAKDKTSAVWKIKIVHYWIWGWMGFYLGISGFFAFNSFGNEGLRMPLALGAVVLCFLYYLLILFLKKSEDKDLNQFSKFGRIFFSFWVLALTLLWFGQKWLN